MKITLLRTLLGAAALLSSTAFAHAAGPFIAGSKWTGFRVSTVGGGMSSATLNVSNNPNSGILNMTGQNVPVSISCTVTGVVDLQGLGVPFAGIHVHGTVAPQGGTYALASNYVINNLPGAHNDSGRLSLLRAYKPVTGGQTIIGGTAGIGLFPPDPCLGTFTSVSGFSGRMVLTHDLPREIGELNPPSEFVGKVSLNDAAFAVVGTINPIANADGRHNIEMLGENLNPTSLQPCIKTVGMLVPAVRTNPTSILGYYELIGLLRTGDRGRFQISQ
ncbi:hypothetical protein [Armatimonas sp.]|uniref:hypothetical protein n=1 Tax=Armatimonas sp. TaxID=1872638 RepID=UPI00286B489C|nr:hypothetical protein [Armatimonas sp.]